MSVFTTTDGDGCLPVEHLIKKEKEITFVSLVNGQAELNVNGTAAQICLRLAAFRKSEHFQGGVTYHKTLLVRGCQMKTMNALTVESKFDKHPNSS